MLRLVIRGTGHAMVTFSSALVNIIFQFQKQYKLPDYLIH